MRVLFFSSPKRKYKRYNKDDLAFAIKEVEERKLSMNKASKKYNVPLKTISWRVNNEKIQKGNDKRGALSILTDEEESKIADYLTKSAK